MVKFVLKCQMIAFEYDFDLGGYVEGGQTLRCLWPVADLHLNIHEAEVQLCLVMGS